MKRRRIFIEMVRPGAGMTFFDAARLALKRAHHRLLSECVVPWELPASAFTLHIESERIPYRGRVQVEVWE